MRCTYFHGFIDTSELFEKLKISEVGALRTKDTAADYDKVGDQPAHLGDRDLLQRFRSCRQQRLLVLRNLTHFLHIEQQLLLVTFGHIPAPHRQRQQHGCDTRHDDDDGS